VGVDKDALTAQLLQLGEIGLRQTGHHCHPQSQPPHGDRAVVDGTAGCRFLSAAGHDLVPGKVADDYDVDGELVTHSNCAVVVAVQLQYLRPRRLRSSLRAPTASSA
jgi:hypothetical protein